MLSKRATIMLGQGSGVVDPGYEARSPTACDVGKRLVVTSSHSFLLTVMAFLGRLFGP